MKSINLIKPFFLENRLSTVFGFIFLIVVDLLQLFIPRILKWVIDDLALFQIDSYRLLFYALEIVGIACLIALFRYGWRRCIIGMSKRVEEGLRNLLFAHTQTLSSSYFDQIKTGDLMAHATNDIQNVRMAVGMGAVALTDAVVLGTAAIGFMAFINIHLTAFVLIPMPFIVLSTRFFSKKMHRRYQAVQSAFSDLTETVREQFAGIRVIKAYNNEEEEVKRLETVSKKYLQFNLNLARIIRSFFPLMLFFSNLSLVIVLYLGGRQTIFFSISPGDFVAFISYLGLLTWPMMALGWVTNLIQRGRASLDRINKILQTESEIKNLPGIKSIQHHKGDIVFENVFFSYGTNFKKSGDTPVISGINFHIKQGTIFGIVGPPGSGKSTLLSLIPRLYDVSEGAVKINGIDIRSIEIGDLRSQISFMPQESFLFARTIRENISFKKKQGCDDSLINAAKQASLYTTMRNFPDRFETIVGEKGIVLSGGQKQRVALARVLFSNSQILILDDPVSQVDLETGNKIISTIKKMAGDRTVIIVSHRFSAIYFADQIIVLDNGKIVEMGDHAYLIKNDGYYARTFHLQEVEEEFRAI
ncbi:MAG: ABC transporter ATP-binding protein [Desulfobacterales bacterium]